MENSPKKPQGGLFLLLLGLIFASLLSCPITTDLFAEYRGVNLIANQGFSAGNWSFEDTTNGPLYLGFAAVTPDTVSGLPESAQADVRRLEILNLMPDGMFEGGALAVGWDDTPFSLDSPPAGTWNFVTTAPGAINGQTLHIDTNKNIQRLDFNLTNILNGLIVNASYLLRFHYRTGDKLTCQIVTHTSPFLPQDLRWILQGGIDGSSTSTPSVNNLNVFPQTNLPDSSFSVTTTDPYYFNFGFIYSSGEPIGGIIGIPLDIYVDDLRVVRTDIPLDVVIRFPLEGATTLPLVSGTYRFGVYVKADPSAGTANRFAANALHMEIVGFRTADPDQRQSAVETHAATEWAGGWIFVSATGFLQLAEDLGATPVLELHLTPCTGNPIEIDAGSILVAGPSLEFLPDGE